MTNKKTKIKKFKASVKVMNSYDYSHFEVSLASDQPMTIEEINGMRKTSQRLVDEAIRQYKIAKEKANQRENLGWETENLKKQFDIINKKPISEWTPEEKAKIKLMGDKDWQSQFDYDYEDDWGEEGG